jgi:hypothetical protein
VSPRGPSPQDEAFLREYRERLALLAALMPALHARRDEVLARPEMAGASVGLPASGSAWLGRLPLTLAVYAHGSAGLLRVEPEGAPPAWLVGASGSMLTGAGLVWTATAEGALVKHAGPRPEVPFVEAWRRFRLAVHSAPRVKPSRRTLWEAAAWLGVAAA